MNEISENIVEPTEDCFKVVVLGNGARELAMVEALYGKGVEIMVIGEKINPQIACLVQWNVATKDPQQIEQLIIAWGAELVLVGSEKYLLPVDANNQISLVDILESEGIPVAAPGYLPSLVELDKSWLIDLLVTRGFKAILPESVICCWGSLDIYLALKTIDNFGEVAIKPAGLTGGKGVKVSGMQLKDKEAAKDYAKALLLEGHNIDPAQNDRQGIYSSGLCL